MRLQPLEGLGVDEEDLRPTVALSLAGRSGLPVLMIAGGRGSGGAASNGGEERDKELELMALPRSDAQQAEDAQVTVGALLCTVVTTAVGGVNRGCGRGGRGDRYFRAFKFFYGVVTRSTQAGRCKLLRSILREPERFVV